MNLGFYAAIAIGVSAGAFLALLAIAAWLESKRWKRIYGPQHYSDLTDRRHNAAAAIKRSAERG